MIKVLVNGAHGRMGLTVVTAVLNDPELELVGAVDAIEAPDVGELIGRKSLNIPIETDLGRALDSHKPDVMVDFTQPAVVFKNVMTALEQIRAESVKQSTPAFIAPNFALGAVLMMKMAVEIAKYFPDVEIIELHHDKKLDAPSGTAALTAKMINTVRAEHRQGHPNEVEKIDRVRGGDVGGVRLHSVRLTGLTIGLDKLLD